MKSHCWWSDLPPPRPGLRCVVVVPARNESRLLPAALTALAAQVGRGHEVLVLANNCTDDTAALARRFAQAHPAQCIHVGEARYPASQANIGHVRGELMDAAARRLEAAGAIDGVIASTDGDSCVAPDWLARTEALLDAGAHAVGGRIATCFDETQSLEARWLMQLDDTYRLLRSKLESQADPDPADPWPRHHQHFGASLAVRLHAYRAVGGLPRVPWLEDEALFQALRRDDFGVRHSLDVRVETSGRLSGRVEVGLSGQLRQWSALAAVRDCPKVSDPADELRHWHWRQRLRRLWEGQHGIDPALLAWRLRALDLDPARARAQMAAAPAFGRLMETIGACRIKPQVRFRQVRLDTAISTLRGLLQHPGRVPAPWRAFDPVSIKPAPVDRRRPRS